MRPNRSPRSVGKNGVEFVTTTPVVGLASASREEFEAWLAPHVRRMSLLASRLAPLADSDDIVQEACIRAWQKRAQFDPERGGASPWLLAITADQARKANRRRHHIGALVEMRASVRNHDLQLDVEHAVAALPARQRLAVECFYFVGLSIAESAAVMACSEGTVKSTLWDARRRLRAALQAWETLETER